MGVDGFRPAGVVAVAVAAANALALPLALPLAMLAGMTLLWAPPAHATDVDTAIVFAVDVSASIDPSTAALQRDGHAAAISSPEVVATIARSRSGCIAITYVEWSSQGQMRLVVPWTSVCGGADAQAVASGIRNEGDRGGCHTHCATSISFAIDLGVLLLESYPGHAARKIIDISANGTNNDGLPVEESRLRAIANGCTINAIALPEVIRGIPHDLTRYFADNVIGGPNAFVMPLSTPRDYALALRWKMVREISRSISSPSEKMLAHR
ncbi:hypothetical protein HNQ96_003875 [Aminobacter lissarensis]|uniref:DUF1194 domain-containing protein n=1 Tax=Aminobacter carboxidus TaxID=376165 RepID=A0A8E2BER1_9HYPH|nr:DUF1194 domain-containing protein [Aminobacter lissarensis]MBB6467992.1 hypothetical protein [Aminobacter lissarensis]